MYPMKIRTLLAVLTFVLFAPAAASAQTAWTGAPGAGVIDEQSVGIYQAGAGSIGYNASGSTSTIIARYNLTDTTGFGAPGWTTIELGAYDPSPSSDVLIKVFRTNLLGSISMISACRSQDASFISKTQCALQTPINFNDGNVYTVEVSISRSSTAVSPLFTGVRLF
jgi:hypothetical protein